VLRAAASCCVASSPRDAIVALRRLRGRASPRTLHAAVALRRCVVREPGASMAPARTCQRALWCALFVYLQVSTFTLVQWEKVPRVRAKK